MEKRIRLPAELNLKNGNKSMNWKLFNQTWDNYEIASGLKDSTNEVRVATFLSTIGVEALEVYNTFDWEILEEEITIEDIICKFKKYCTPKVNLTYERYRFNTRKQQDGEDIDSYVTAFRVLANYCEFGVIKDSLIKDILVLGVNDERLRESLLRDSDLTLDKAISSAQAAERCKKENQAMKNKDEEVDEIKGNVDYSLDFPIKVLVLTLNLVIIGRQLIKIKKIKTRGL